MKNILFSFLVVTSLGFVGAQSFDSNQFPICDRSADSSIVCPFSGSTLPEDTMVLLRDYCPDGDASLNSFDNSCLVNTGAITRVESGVNIVPFGSVSKYINLSAAIEDGLVVMTESQDGEYIQITQDDVSNSDRVEQSFLSTGAYDDYNIFALMILMSVLGYFAI